MSKIITKTIKWTPDPSSQDIVSHRVYVEKDPAVPDYASPFVDVPMPVTQIDAPSGFPAGTFDEDTNYSIGLSAVDDMGNESDIVVISSPFDFIAPGAPTNVIVV